MIKIPQIGTFSIEKKIKFYSIPFFKSMIFITSFFINKIYVFYLTINQTNCITTFIKCYSSQKIIIKCFI